MPGVNREKAYRERESEVHSEQSALQHVVEELEVMIRFKETEKAWQKRPRNMYKN